MKLHHHITRLQQLHTIQHLQQRIIQQRQQRIIQQRQQRIIQQRQPHINLITKQPNITNQMFPTNLSFTCFNF
jgi:hypothetical protein